MKKCLIIANSFKENAGLLGNEISVFLKKENIENSLFLYDGKEVRSKILDIDFSGYDFVVTLGGDGTVLFACRGCSPLGIPVFPINLGEFGFIAAVPKDNWKKELELFLREKCYISSRSDASLTCDGQIDFELKEGDVLILKIPEFRARLICSTQEKFFSALQSKLNWSGGPRA